MQPTDATRWTFISRRFGFIAAGVVILAVLAGYQALAQIGRVTLQSEWKKVETEDSPGDRSEFTLTYHPKAKLAVLFGGRNVRAEASDIVYDDTWLFDGKEWKQLDAGQGPPARYGHAMVYDAAREEIVLFGGMGKDGKPLDDLWTFNGERWSRRFATGGPSERGFHAMAYDEPRQQVVLFGGKGLKNAMDDIWLWDGLRWTAKAVRKGPAPRYGHAMVYDPQRKRTVMFGGTEGGFPALADTWEWTGTEWEEVSPEASPPAGDTFAMAWDADNKEVVIFGSRINDKEAEGFGRTWTFDGKTWKKLDDFPGGPARTFGGGLAYHEEAKALLLYTGRSLKETKSETWLRE